MLAFACQFCCLCWALVLLQRSNRNTLLCLCVWIWFVLFALGVVFQFPKQWTYAYLPLYMLLVCTCVASAHELIRGMKMRGFASCECICLWFCRLCWFGAVLRACITRRGALLLSIWCHLCSLDFWTPCLGSAMPRNKVVGRMGTSRQFRCPVVDAACLRCSVP